FARNTSVQKSNRDYNTIIKLSWQSRMRDELRTCQVARSKILATRMGVLAGYSMKGGVMQNEATRVRINFSNREVEVAGSEDSVRGWMEILDPYIKAFAAGSSIIGSTGSETPS